MSERERQVQVLLSEGRNITEIAEVLSVSRHDAARAVRHVIETYGTLEGQRVDEAIRRLREIQVA